MRSCGHDVGDEAVGQGRVDEVLVGAHALHVGGLRLAVDRDDAAQARRRRDRARRSTARGRKRLEVFLARRTVWPAGIASYDACRRATAASWAACPVSTDGKATARRDGTENGSGSSASAEPRAGRAGRDRRLGEPQRRRRDVLLEVADVPGARDRQHVRARARGSRRSGPGPASRRGRPRSTAPRRTAPRPCPRGPAPAMVKNGTNAIPACGRQPGRRRCRTARSRRVPVLHADDRRHVAGGASASTPDVGQPDVLEQALVAQGGQCRDRCRDVVAAVAAVVHDVEPVQAEGLEVVLDVVAQSLGARPSRPTRR